MLGLWTTGGTPPDRVLKIQQAVATAVLLHSIFSLAVALQVVPESGQGQELMYQKKID